MDKKWTWKRKSDGVEIQTSRRMSYEMNHEQILATRLDNGRKFWVSWGGLASKYERINKESN